MIESTRHKGHWPTLDTVIQQHGAWTVLGAALGALLRRRRRNILRPGDLPEYLRRDVGLEPYKPERAYWDYL